MYTEKHASRTGKQGTPLSVKHNDRNFNVGQSIKHPEKTVQNVYWTYMDKVPVRADAWKGHKTFEETEEFFYKKYFSAAMQKKQEKDIQQRHPERLEKHTTEGLRLSPRTCPEEEILQIGQVGDNVSEKVLMSAYMEYLRWETKAYPNVVYLDFAMHMDETCPHIHARRVFVAHDKDGNLIPAENAALKEMGVKSIPIEYTDKNGEIRTKNSTLKQAYTKACRDKWEEIVRSRGIDLSQTRKNRGQVGLDFAEVKAREIEADAMELRDEAQNVVQQAKTEAKTVIAAVSQQNPDVWGVLQRAEDNASYTKIGHKIILPADIYEEMRQVIISCGQDYTLQKSSERLSDAILQRPDIIVASDMEKRFKKQISGLQGQLVDVKKLNKQIGGVCAAMGFSTVSGMLHDARVQQMIYDTAASDGISRGMAQVKVVTEKGQETVSLDAAVRQVHALSVQTGLKASDVVQAYMDSPDFELYPKRTRSLPKIHQSPSYRRDRDDDYIR